MRARLLAGHVSSNDATWSHLAAKDVEVVDGGRAVDDLPVGGLDLGAEVAPGEPVALIHGRHGVRVFVRHLQEAFDARGRVLRALAVIAVGQQHCQAGLQQR